MNRYHIHILAVFFLFSFLSCGKKGPLEPPVIRVPKDIELLVLKQRGGDVFLQWRNPTHYIDGNPIREISQVEIWILEKDRDLESSQEPVTGKDFKREGKLLIAIPEEAFADYSIQGSTGSPVLQFVHSLDKDFLNKNYFFSFCVVDVRKRKSNYSEPVLFVPSVLPLPRPMFKRRFLRTKSLSAGIHLKRISISRCRLSSEATISFEVKMSGRFN